MLRFVDSDGQGAQPTRIANRYISGAAVDQLLADEQYAIGTGPAVSATKASAVEGNTLWALTDHLGSVRDLVDNNGVIREHNVYDSFGRLVREVDYNATGQVIASTDPAAVDTLFGYTGRLFDSHTGLQYNRARWYDASTGRWLSQDPIGFAAGDANLYRYVGNGPVDSVDPTGLEEPDLHDGIGPELLREMLPKTAGPQTAAGMLASIQRIRARFNQMRFMYGDPSKFGGKIVFQGNDVRKYLSFEESEWGWNPDGRVSAWEFLPTLLETNENKLLRQGCVGLNKIRLNSGKEVQNIQGTRAFSTLAAALRAQSEMLANYDNETRIVLSAYQDNYPNSALTDFLLHGSESEYDLDKIRMIRGGFPELEKNVLINGFDFYTLHQRTDLSILFFENMDYGESSNPHLKVNHKSQIPVGPGTIYYVTPIRDHMRAPLCPRGQLDGK